MRDVAGRRGDWRRVQRRAEQSEEQQRSAYEEHAVRDQVAQTGQQALAHELRELALGLGDVALLRVARVLHCLAAAAAVRVGRRRL